ncbi:DUF1127 domain-containing protein [Jiella mangrovi]|uniref:DUF1127 domain-containing protein n=1 Tax=Jiella mangrovi TaxID=2821407 RepID=A0ABS4BFE0_9HYPH|nr:DUF1127 domain-containing protein [Jiella mangrovi]MBP0615476.1 DUF1127 domain-containing protein [Jiella mangrovi]
MTEASKRLRPRRERQSPPLLLRLLRKWTRRRSRLALSELSDCQLRDIGVSRQEALTEAGKPFWR